MGVVVNNQFFIVSIGPKCDCLLVPTLLLCYCCFCFYMSTLRLRRVHLQTLAAVAVRVEDALRMNMHLVKIASTTLEPVAPAESTPQAHAPVVLTHSSLGTTGFLEVRSVLVENSQEPIEDCHCRLCECLHVNIVRFTEKITVTPLPILHIKHYFQSVSFCT